MRILVASGSGRDTSTLARAFGRHAFVSLEARSTEDALCFIETTGVDLAIVSLDGDRGDDLSVLREIRVSEPRAPILAVTTKDDAADRNRALIAGADVAISHPSPIREIVARATSMLRRSRGYSSNTLISGDVSVELLHNEVRFGGKLAALAQKEYAFLRLLVLHPGRIMSKDDLLSRMYDDDNMPCDKIMDVYCSHVRRHMVRIDPTMTSRIDTIAGRGWVFHPHPKWLPRAARDLQRLQAARVWSSEGMAIAAE